MLVWVRSSMTETHGCSWSPGEHHQDQAAAAELPGLPAEAGRVRRRGRRDAAREPGARAHHARRQRLRQQLLPRALLHQVSPVRHPGLRPLPHIRVQEDPLGKFPAVTSELFFPKLQ
jgi:hypothetical protein